MLTATDVFNARVYLAKQENEKQISNERVLAHFIKEDRASPEKLAMKDGVNYYRGVQSINDKKRIYKKDGKNIVDSEASNKKLSHSFHRIIVDQKVGYIVGKPIQITPQEPDNKEQMAFQLQTEDILGEKFEDCMTNYVKGASNKGQEFLHPFVNSDGEFDYICIGAEQCIPIYDSRYEARLTELIRYYNVEQIDANGEKRELIKAEWWTKNNVTFYIEEKENKYSNKLTFVLDINEVLNGGNPRPHWIRYNTNDIEEGKDGEEIIQNAEQGSWGRVPFIRLLNNHEGLSDLNYYKSLVDEYDYAQSDLADKISDIADAVWKLVGYEGQSASEFRKNLKEFKVILLGDDGSADAETITIPTEAAKALMDRLSEDIFLFAMAVNVKSERLGNAISGVALKFLYTLLDLKANVLIKKMKLALREFMYFVSFYIKELSEDKADYNYKSLAFTFDKSIIINEQEKIQNLVVSGDIISEATKTEEHPYAKENEEERKEQELSKKAEQFDIPDEDDNEDENE